MSGVNSELVSALQHLTGHTVQLKEASREAKAAAEAAAEAAAAAESEKLDVAGQLQDLEEAYKELQQKHGQLSVSVAQLYSCCVLDCNRASNVVQAVCVCPAQ